MGCLYYIRHGETEWNKLDLICGRTDVELTEKGHQQAIEAGRKLQETGVKIDLIIHSPLKRTVDTAKHIQEYTGAPMKAEARIIEQDYGKYEGTDRLDPQFRFDKAQFACRFRNGESAMQLAKRVYQVLDEVTAQPDKVCILVAHNGLSRVVHSYFNDLDNEAYSNYRIQNCEIVKYEF